MWIFTKHGFFSAVCARQGDGHPSQPVDANRMMIRARSRSHLEALKGRFAEQLGQAEIQTFTNSDYPFRIFVPKTTWVVILAELGEEVDYDNFKTKVANYQGRSGGDYGHALHEVWGIMNALPK